jgi:hypothetical protein
MAKTMMAPSRMNKASAPCLSASMRTPGEKCSKKVRELLEKGNAPKLSKNHTVHKKSAETVQAANQGINRRNAWIY